MEVRVAGLVALHQTVKLPFADAVARVNLVRQQVGRGTRSGLGQPWRGDVRIARVVDGGAVGQAVGLGHVEQIGRAEIHGVEDVVLALRFRPLCHRATDDGSGTTPGLTCKAFVLRDAGGRAGLFQFFCTNRSDGGGECIVCAGEGNDGLPDGFEAVQNAQNGDEHLRMSLLFYVHRFPVVVVYCGDGKLFTKSAFWCQAG